MKGVTTKINCNRMAKINCNRMARFFKASIQEYFGSALLRKFSALCRVVLTESSKKVF